MLQRDIEPSRRLIIPYLIFYFFPDFSASFSLSYGGASAAACGAQEGGGGDEEEAGGGEAGEH